MVKVADLLNGFTFDQQLVVKGVVPAYDSERAQCATGIGARRLRNAFLVGSFPDRFLVRLGLRLRDAAFLLPLVERSLDFVAQPPGVAAPNTVWPLRQHLDDGLD